MIPTRTQLHRLAYMLGDGGDKSADDIRGSLKLAEECFFLQADVINAMSANVTDENKWLWENEPHKPEWTYRGNMHHELKCACGRTFTDMFEKDAIDMFFSHLAEVHYFAKIRGE